jgi:hypothetical protein
MEYFLVQRYWGDLPGHPTFFDYSLDKAAAGENVRESSIRVYFTSYRNSPLVFLCKNRKIEFDFYDLPAGEYFVSSVFADVAAQVNVPGLRSIEAKVLSVKRKSISSKDYRILRIPDALDAVDHQRSVIEPAVTAPHRLLTRHLAIDHSAVGGRDLFRLNNMALLGCLFCSARFKEKAEQAGVVARFIPEAEAAEAEAARNPLAPK